MSSRSWASETSWTANVPRTLPSRSTVTRWQSSRTSASRCVMYTTATPLAAIRRSSANSVAESSAPRAAVGSSRISTAGSEASALATSSRCRWATVRLLTRWPRPARQPTRASCDLAQDVASLPAVRTWPGSHMAMFS